MHLEVNEILLYAVFFNKKNLDGNTTRQKTGK